MKITANSKGEIILEEVYSGVGLRTKDGEFMGICMRDTGFEFSYNGTWYSAQKGVISKLKKPSPKGVVQTLNPRTGKYVKINSEKGSIICQKKTKGPYKNIPIIAFQ